MDLEGITLSEISQMEKDKYGMISLICEILKKLINKNKQTKSIIDKCRCRDQWWLLEWKGQRESEMGKGDELFAERWKLNFWW